MRVLAALKVTTESRKDSRITDTCSPWEEVTKKRFFGNYAAITGERGKAPSGFGLSGIKNKSWRALSGILPPATGSRRPRPSYAGGVATEAAGVVWVRLAGTFAISGSGDA